MLEICNKNTTTKTRVTYGNCHLACPGYCLPKNSVDSVSKWCHDTGSLINPDNAQTLWCTLDNRAADKPVPAVTFAGAVVERTSHLRYLGIHFDRMLTYRKHVETTALKCKKGLSVLKAVAAKGIEQRQLWASQQWHRQIC